MSDHAPNDKPATRVFRGDWEGYGARASIAVGGAFLFYSASK